MYIAIILVPIIVLLIGIILWSKASKLKKALSEKAIQEVDWQTKKKVDQLKEEAAAFELQINEQIANMETTAIEKQQRLQTIIENNEQVIQQQEKHKQLLIEKGQELVDKEIDNYKIIQKGILDKEIQDEKHQFQLHFQETKANLENYLLQRQNEINDEIVQLLVDKTEVEIELEDFRSRRAAVNEAILREKEIQEQETFYKITLTKNDIEDISILREIEPRLCNKEALNKLIYEVFIKSPSQEMIKRITKGRKISGIYKITYIKTGEAYIGKSADIKTRWTNHIKTACGLSGCSPSLIHSKMRECGLWQFTFEILAEAENNKLNELEKYYIDFYDTITYGFNRRVG